MHGLGRRASSKSETIQAGKGESLAQGKRGHQNEVSGGDVLRKIKEDRIEKTEG